MPQVDQQILVQRRPHGQRNHPQRQQRQAVSESPELTPVKRWALVISLCVLLFSMVLVIWVGGWMEMKKYTLNFFDYKEDKKVSWTPGKILEKLVEDCERLITVEQEFLALGDINALVALVKQKYQPIQDRVTSLTTLTSQYERMERTGTIKPQQFMSTALEELTALEERILDMDDKQMQEILLRDAAVAEQLLQDYKSLIEQDSYKPPPEVDAIDGGKYIDNLIIKHGFDEVIMVVRNLAPVLLERDGLMNELLRIKDELEIDDVNGVFMYKQLPEIGDEEGEKKFQNFTQIVRRYEYLMDAAVDYIKANGTIIQLLLPHHSILGNKVSDLVTNYNTFEGKKRMGYLNMRTELLNDIANLQVRIRKL